MFLSKHHGLGNDFLVVLDDRQGHPVAIDPALAIRLCHRRTGIGADGLIHGIRPTDEQRAAGIDVVMRLINSDGSPAEMSGNGIRCLGQAVAQAQERWEGTITVLTDAGLRPLEITPGPDAATVMVSVGMGEPGQGPHIPAPVGEFLTGRFATVDMGNPHLVVVVDDPATVDLTTEGGWLEAQFPGGMNIEYIAPTADGTALALRVWERGAGVTNACGTGACAAAHQARRWGLVGDQVTVSMPGGDARVVLEADGTATLIGPSVHIAEVVVAAEAGGPSTSAGLTAALASAEGRP